MIDPPKRTGYRLTYDAECLYNDWQEIGGCSCHTGCAPCRSCHNDGHPISLEENDDAWEIDSPIADVYNAWKLKQEMEMSRQDITNKSDPPKSEWFGYKYRVTPETSKLLQEAVFKDGGGWGYDCEGKVAHTYKPFLIVRGKEITFSDDEHYFETCVLLPEKQPPQPTKKEFIVGKYYKYILQGLGVFKTGKYYKLSKANGGLLFTEDMYRYMRQEAFDINSESDYDPNAAQPAGYTAYVVFKQDFTEGVLQKGGYGGKEYAYKCSFENRNQAHEQCNVVFAEVVVNGVEKKVKVLRIEAKVDPKATKSIVRILPKELAKDVETSRIRTYRAEDVTVSIGGVSLEEVLKCPEFSGSYAEQITKLKSHAHLGNKSGNNATTNVGDVNMSTQNRVVSVKFFDDDAGLKAEHSLVAEYQVTTRVSDQMTISKVLLTEDVAGDIVAHNGIRANTVDLHILKQTGNKVMLQPIEFEDLRVEVRQV